MNKNALLIGNSDGIGLAATRKLLNLGWQVTGISRSASPIQNSDYIHIVADVRHKDYQNKLKSALDKAEPIDICIFCVGIGELLDTNNMENELMVFEVNLMAMVKTISIVIPTMHKNGHGHFIGLSSVADELLSAEAPSYHASKAAFSNYLQGMALALKAQKVYITNVRFGFVDTKMAKGDVKPFMISKDKAVQHLMKCIDKKPVRYTAPKIVIPLIIMRKLMMRLGM